jgi:transposase
MYFRRTELQLPAPSASERSFGVNRSSRSFLPNPIALSRWACASSHFWAREIGKLGHEVRLIPPAYVKPFVKRQKNDAADAEAICEAAQRPTMRFVAVKSEEKQASAVIFKTRDLLVAQITQIINALRGHLGEYGFIAPQGVTYVDRLIAEVESNSSSALEAARACLLRLVDILRELQAEIVALDAEVAVRAKRDAVAKRLMTIPGIGPVIATAIEALAPPAETFRSGRDFAAWMGLKPPMLVIVALANKTARVAWAVMTRGEVYRAPPSVA